MKCLECGGGCFRPQCVPSFTEDRLRLYRNPHRGDRYCYALGHEMPDSRRELERECKQRGIYFDDTPTQRERRCMEYAEHVRTGGERLPFEAITPPEPVDTKPMAEAIGRWVRSKGDFLPDA